MEKFKWLSETLPEVHINNVGMGGVSITTSKSVFVVRYDSSRCQLKMRYFDRNGEEISFSKATLTLKNSTLILPYKILEEEKAWVFEFDKGSIRIDLTLLEDTTAYFLRNSGILRMIKRGK